MNQYIRATATYTDSDETANKEAMRASAGVVTDRQTDSFRPPGNTGGGGGGGGAVLPPVQTTYTATPLHNQLTSRCLR